jgi:AcrR family transcriptional regulator
MRDTVKNGSRREEQIIEQALKLFSEGGYRTTSLKVIADRLGITRPAFYYYFKSKDDLLWQLVGHLGDQLLRDAEPIVASSEPPVVKLRQLIESHLRTLLENAEAFKIYIAERHLVPAPQNDTMKRGEERYLELIQQVIEEGQREGSFRADSSRLLALLVNGFANSVLRWYRPGGKLSAENLTELVSDMTLAAVLAPGDDTGNGLVTRSPRIRAAKHP